jgi:hypothetical protein
MFATSVSLFLLSIFTYVSIPDQETCVKEEAVKTDTQYLGNGIHLPYDEDKNVVFKGFDANN